ncbi:MAG: lysophospholipase [Candidatus Cyclobacteriaceae bacterium M2_1C_046]
MKKSNSLKTKDHLKIATEEFLVPESRASVILVHGLGEYKDRYHHIAEAFNQAGFSFFSFDLRGHGDSQGKRGYTPSYDALLDDLNVVIEYVAQHNDTPIVLYGHSMGGNIVANYLIRKKDKRIYAAIITSPWFRLRMKASSIKLAIGLLALKIFPSLAQSTNLNPEFLSHDPQVIKEYTFDPKIHSKITPSLFFGAREAGEFAIKNASSINIPLLVTHGTGDNITDPDATKEFAQNADENATLKLWTNLYHETHNEFEKSKVIQSTIKWLEEQNLQ